MKYVLVVILCSGYQGMCLDPFAFPNKYDDVYSCLMDGYQKSIEKTEELGRKQVNKYKIFIKFDCYEDKTYKATIKSKQLEQAISSINKW